MKFVRVLIVILIGLSLTPVSYGASMNAPEKKKILVVSSYHREYLWEETNKEFCNALLKFGYFDNRDRIAEYIEFADALKGKRDDRK